LRAAVWELLAAVAGDGGRRTLSALHAASGLRALGGVEPRPTGLHAQPVLTITPGAATGEVLAASGASTAVGHIGLEVDLAAIGPVVVAVLEALIAGLDAGTRGAGRGRHIGRGVQALVPTGSTVEWVGALLTGVAGTELRVRGTLVAAQTR